jgi:hypothetical protein
VLLVFGAPCQLPLLAGPEHGRTIPLADMIERTEQRFDLKPGALNFLLTLVL